MAQKPNSSLCNLIVEISRTQAIRYIHTLCRNPLNEWTSRRRGLYQHKKNSKGTNIHAARSPPRVGSLILIQILALQLISHILLTVSLLRTNKVTDDMYCTNCVWDCGLSLSTHNFVIIFILLSYYVAWRGPWQLATCCLIDMSN